jgi:hypothetical protein
MKKSLLIILAAVSVGIAGCTKSKSAKPISAPIISSYLPVTSGSNWTYELDSPAGADTGSTRMTGATTTINNRLYYGFTGTSKLLGSTSGYYFNANHICGMRALNAAAGTTVELEFLNDTLASGRGWESSPTDNGLIKGYPARCVNSIRGTGILIGLGPETFTNVTYSHIDLQYNPGGGFQNIASYDIYLCKNIGLISIVGYVSGNVVQNNKLLAYTIK